MARLARRAWLFAVFEVRNGLTPPATWWSTIIHNLNEEVSECWVITRAIQENGRRFSLSMIAMFPGLKHRGAETSSEPKWCHNKETNGRTHSKMGEDRIGKITRVIKHYQTIQYSVSSMSKYSLFPGMERKDVCFTTLHNCYWCPHSCCLQQRKKIRAPHWMMETPTSPLFKAVQNPPQVALAVNFSGYVPTYGLKVSCFRQQKLKHGRQKKPSPVSSTVRWSSQSNPPDGCEILHQFMLYPIIYSYS